MIIFPNFDLQPYLERYYNIDPEEFILSLHDNDRQKARIVAEQLKIYPKARIKLPTFTNVACFFTSKSFEQASSESLALYKASLFEGECMLDLSGGLGVDDWAFTSSFKLVISIDPDVELNNIVRRNFQLLNLTNISRLDTDAHSFIPLSPRVDLIYIDADRRPGTGRKITNSLRESQPDILGLMEQLFKKSETIVLKLSPMLDLTYLKKELKYIEHMYIISLFNEVKEILVVLRKGSIEPRIHAVDINKDQIYHYQDPGPDVRNYEYKEEGEFLYEPSLSLIKSGLAHKYAAKKNMIQLAPGSLFFFSDYLVSDFFGRVFKVIKIVHFSKVDIKKYFIEHSITKANISKRNFPSTVDEIRKVFQIREGGDDYLFFSTNHKKEKVMIHCEKY